MSSLGTFIESTLTQFETASEAIVQYKEQGMRGRMFERLWDICIRLGFVDQFPKDVYTYKSGNVNTGKIITCPFDVWLEEKWNRGNSSGVSDITLFNEINKEFIFMSCKFPNVIQKRSVQYYDIQNIIAAINLHKDLYQKFQIFVLAIYTKNFKFLFWPRIVRVFLKKQKRPIVVVNTLPNT